MGKAPSDINEQLTEAIESSEFGSISRLSEHLGVHYNCLYQYARLQRDPIDRWGYAKYDVLAISDALGVPLENLFPPDVLQGGYELPDADHVAKHGPRAKKRKVEKYFPEREVSAAQAKAVIRLLDIKALAKADQVKPLAQELIRRLKPEEYDVFSRMAFEGMGADDTAKALSISPRAVRARYQNTLKFLNSPATMRVLKDLR